MFKKINTTILIVVLIILLGIYFAARFFDTSDRSFREIIVEVEPEKVTQVVINDPQNDKPVNIMKEGDRWFVVKPSGKYPADTNVVKNIIAQVGSLKTKRYAGKGEDQWDKYQVTDSAATTVELIDRDETLTRLMIGKFSYNMPKDQNQQQMMGRQQQQGDMTTYVRLADENEVYAVDGFLKMNFNRDPDSYRDKTLVSVNQSDIQRVEFNYDGRQTLLERTGQGWTLGGTPADSASVLNYVRTLSKLSSSNFLNEDYSGRQASHKVNIQGNNFVPIELAAYPVSDTNINYAIYSSHNPTAYFNGKKSDLFEKIFIEETELLEGNP
jgi:hypothetical protein